ncbi:MAG: hypothetical protein AB1390_11445, partial [Nitrospirota bacterium]
MSRQYGLIISLFVHAIILAIPVSMIVKNNIREVELFVFIEEARTCSASVIAQREIVKKVNPIQEKKPRPEKVEKIEKHAEVLIPEEHKQEV